MNILADENVDQPIVERLRQDGHVVLSVAEMEPGLDGIARRFCRCHARSDPHPPRRVTSS